MTTKKTQDTPEERSGDSIEIDEAAQAAMKSQLTLTLYNLIKQAEEMGVNLNEMFPKPPVATTVVSDDPRAAAAPSTERARQPGVAVQPGIPNSPWWEWTKADLKDYAKVTFVPHSIPGIVYPKLDELGRQKIRFDINNLVCWLTVGEPNEVYDLFYLEYKNKEREYMDGEMYKKKGPENAPWGLTGPGGQPAWLYQPFARSYGIDIDGLSLGPGSETIDKYLEATE